MPPLNMSFAHGQTFEAARANFEKGITEAQRSKFGSYIKGVEWAPDRNSAQLTGSGFDVNLSVDETAVHATGKVPFFARFLEAPVRKYLEEMFKRPPAS